MNPSTPLLTSLAERAADVSERPILYWVNRQGVEKPVTAKELHQFASATAQHLQAQGVGRGEIILLCQPHSVALIATFLGALYLGAVPSILPDTIVESLLKPEVQVAQLLQLIQTSQARLIVTAPDVAQQLHTMAPELPCIPSEPQGGFASQVILPTEIVRGATGTEPLYLQQTSGTTDTRKGVLLSHQAVVHCLNGFVERLRIGPTDVVVNWLPLYHDFGLFAGLLLPIVLGIPVVLLAPSTVVRRPERWLWAIHNHRATLSWIFNGGYHLIAKNVKPERLTGLDLSSLRVLGCGGESVRWDSQTIFAEQFKPFGLSETALVVGYGLAETVMCVTSTPTGDRASVDWVDPQTLGLGQSVVSLKARAPTATAIVSCGPPLAGVEARTVSATGVPLTARQVGELQLRGPMLFTTYTDNERMSVEPPLFTVDGWFATGDLGYFYDGEFYFCERKKDLIIVGGRNIYPQQLEALAHQILGDHIRRLLAFGLSNPRLGTELPVIVYEARPRTNSEAWHKQVNQLRQQVQLIFGVALADLRQVPRRWIVITTSGKLARGATRQKYMDAGYADLKLQTSERLTANPLPNLQNLQIVAQTMLAIPEIDLETNFFELGLTSLQIFQFLTKAEEIFDQSVEIETFLTRPTLAHLIHLLASSVPSVPTTSSFDDIPANLFAEKVYAPVAARQPFPGKRSLNQRFINRIKFGPPLWVKLPYRLGTFLLRQFIQHPVVQRQIYQHEVALFRECLVDLNGIKDHTSLIEQNLLVNSWHRWRTQALSQPKPAKSWLNFKGASVIETLQREQQGIILAVPHTKLKYLCWSLPLFQSQTITAIGNLSAESLARIGLPTLAEQVRQGQAVSQQMVYTAQVHRAGEVLKAGGIVVITPDIAQRATGIKVPFYGRWRTIEVGWADLAVETDAVIVPTFPALALSGQVTFDFTQPLARPTGTRAQQRKQLIYQYAQRLSDYWAQVLPQLEWYMLRRFLNLPQITRTPSTNR